jgi:hypothetical protein
MKMSRNSSSYKQVTDSMVGRKDIKEDNAGNKW